ncbi:MAG: YicC/YloC family endoribonuclease [Myxococcota bacterium]|jgi:uncharacterized protein (TIGR00255 family)
MTGFGRVSFQVESREFDVEVRSVNHRFLDARVRLPREAADLDAEIRARISRQVARGKVDLSVIPHPGSTPAPELEVDWSAAAQYAQAARRLRESEGLDGALDVGTALGLPGVARFVEPVLAGEALGPTLLDAVDAALDALDEMRRVEGAALERDVLSRLEGVVGIADILEEREGTVRDLAKNRLRKRAEQLAQDTGLYDEARLHQEIVIAADRMDVTEEIVRLRSHVNQFRTIVESAGVGSPAGRRLDFLLQELGREANTIGSKANDAPIAHHVVELKAEIERIREQVQNVE